MIRAGDRLICISPGYSNYLTYGKEYVAETDECRTYAGLMVKVIADGGISRYRFVYRFQLAPSPSPFQQSVRSWCAEALK